MSPIVTACAPPCLARRNDSHFLTAGPNPWVSTFPIQGFQALWPGFAPIVRGSFPLQPPFWPPSRSYISASIDGRWRQRQSFNPLKEIVEDSMEELFAVWDERFCTAAGLAGAV